MIDEKTLAQELEILKEIKDNSNITEVHNWGEIYKYIFNMTKERNNKI